MSFYFAANVFLNICGHSCNKTCLSLDNLPKSKHPIFGARTLFYTLLISLPELTASYDRKVFEKGEILPALRDI